ncbi:hypothetical protein B0I33_112178 [Prauserella shujinwangii]|uniref:Uncharacterized protein n=1 Tax=Prauserella shujinwangii TaxID=1453103 RepID=A0A2T0LMN1_9PSEU|nr:hypothetical protein [Prauserella shujinwangii]PRX44300.1 hypothetical protein B0I33_112178 [Prauserella shujinwangii]
MPTDTRPDGRAVSARRSGYLVAALLSGALLYAAHAWPGWAAVPFLTERTDEVLGLVTATLVAGIAANVAYLVRDPRWLRSLGDIVTTSIGLAALVRIWAVFPFDFGDPDVGWALVARVVLGFAVVGSAIGIAVSLVCLVRAAGHRE